ncbi:MAG: protein kinase [Parachlamydiaceae bacterium]|nr:protein kinase [Parachlamydiaceae bacterium]
MSTESLKSENSSSQVQAASHLATSSAPSKVSTRPISTDVINVLQILGKEIETLNKRDENVLLRRQDYQELSFIRRLFKSDNDIKTEEIAIANDLIKLKVPLQNQKDKFIKEYEKATNNQEKGQIQFKIANICVKLGEKRNAVEAYKEARKYGFNEAEEYLPAAEELFKATLQEERRIIEIVDAFAPKKIREDRYYKRGTMIAHRNLQPITKILDNEKITKIKTNQFADTQERGVIFFNTLKGIGKELSKHSPDNMLEGQKGSNPTYETFISKEGDIVIQDKSKKSGAGATKHVYTSMNLKNTESLVSFGFSESFDLADFDKEQNILKALNNAGAKNIMKPIKDIGILVQQKHHLVEQLFTIEGNMSERLEIMQGIANGLAGIHKKGFIHNDLKPANFFYEIDKDGKLIGKIGDFGSAFTFGHPDSFYGATKTHAAPEVLTGQKISQASDCFSFGVCLFQSATSDHYERLHKGRDVKELFQNKSQPQIDFEIDEQINFLRLALNPDAIMKEINNRQEIIRENEDKLSEIDSDTGSILLLEEHNEKLKIKLEDLEKYKKLTPEQIQLAIKQLIVARKLIRRDPDERISAERAHLYLTQKDPIPKEISDLDNKSQNLIGKIKEEVILFAKSLQELQKAKDDKTENLTEYKKQSQKHLDRINKYLIQLNDNKFKINELSDNAKSNFEIVNTIKDLNIATIEDKDLELLLEKTNSYLQQKIQNEDQKSNYQIALKICDNFIKINDFVFSGNVPIKSTIQDLETLGLRDEENSKFYQPIIELYKKVHVVNKAIILLRKKSKIEKEGDIEFYTKNGTLSVEDKKQIKMLIKKIKSVKHQLESLQKEHTIKTGTNNEILDKITSSLIQAIENLEKSINKWDASGLQRV